MAKEVLHKLLLFKAAVCFCVLRGVGLFLPTTVYNSFLASYKYYCLVEQCSGSRVYSCNVTLKGRENVSVPRPPPPLRTTHHQEYIIQAFFWPFGPKLKGTKTQFFQNSSKISPKLKQNCLKTQYFGKTFPETGPCTKHKCLLSSKNDQLQKRAEIK